MKRQTSVSLHALATIGLLGLSAGAGAQENVRQPRTGAAAFGDWRTDAPGVWRKITASDVPPATRGSANISRIVKRPVGAMPKVPPGFSVNLFASGFSGPRVMRVAPNGDIFLAETRGGRVRVLRTVDGAAQPSQVAVFASGLNEPFGIAFYPPGPNPRFLYVATTTEVIRYPYTNGALAPSGTPEAIVWDIPSGGHTTRDLAFSPDGSTLYVSIGSASNAAEGLAKKSPAEIADFEKAHGFGAAWAAETNRADVLAFDPDGHNQRPFANGIRNCAGLAMQPATGELWCATNERDMLGDNLPPEFATHVQAGAFYGWPWYYIGDHQDPRHSGERPDLADKITIPDVLMQAHSAPLGIAFYEGGQFPAEYKGDAFVTLHGSWNRSLRTGYKLVRLKFENGKPTGEYEDFLTGFVADDSSVWGRPVGVAVAHDGSLLMSEDANGTIWRISYERK